MNAGAADVITETVFVVKVPGTTPEAGQSAGGRVVALALASLRRASWFQTVGRQLL